MGFINFNHFPKGPFHLIRGYGFADAVKGLLICGFKPDIDIGSEGQLIQLVEQGPVPGQKGAHTAEKIQKGGAACPRSEPESLVRRFCGKADQVLSRGQPVMVAEEKCVTILQVRSEMVFKGGNLFQDIFP